MFSAAASLLANQHSKGFLCREVPTSVCRNVTLSVSSYRPPQRVILPLAANHNPIDYVYRSWSQQPCKSYADPPRLCIVKDTSSPCMCHNKHSWILEMCPQQQNDPAAAPKINTDWRKSFMCHHLMSANHCGCDLLLSGVHIKHEGMWTNVSSLVGHRVWTDDMNHVVGKRLASNAKGFYISVRFPQ